MRYSILNLQEDLFPNSIFRSLYWHHCQRLSLGQPWVSLRRRERNALKPSFDSNLSRHRPPFTTGEAVNIGGTSKHSFNIRNKARLLKTARMLNVLDVTQWLGQAMNRNGQSGCVRCG